jgi:hypothetical protein
LKHILPLITAVIFLPLTCLARLGETKQQLDIRYGKPISDEKIGTQTQRVGYANNGFCFTIYITNNKAVAFIVSYLDNQPMTDQEIKLFLDKNSSGSGYKFDSLNSDMTVKIFVESDSDRLARYYPSDPKSDNFSPRLVIATKEGMDLLLDYWTKLIDKKTRSF